MLLRELAHARTGDKGSLVTISLIVYRDADFRTIAKHVTADRVGALFSEIVHRPVLRYALPHLGTLNFVLQRPETQSVTRSLALDAHGKCLGSALLAMDIENDEDLP